MKCDKCGKSINKEDSFIAIMLNFMAEVRKDSRLIGQTGEFILCEDCSDGLKLDGDDITMRNVDGKLDAVYVDPAVQLVEEAVAETGVQPTDREKSALANFIREEVKRRTILTLDVYNEPDRH